MAAVRERIRATWGIFADDTSSDLTAQDYLSKEDEGWALRNYPDLYLLVTREHTAPLNYIVKAKSIALHSPTKPAGDHENKKLGERQARARVGLFLEYQAIKKFSDKHEGIQKLYISKSPLGGCALTGDDRVHVVTNTNDPELLLYADKVMELCRNARRAFDDGLPEAASEPPSKRFQWRKAARYRRRINAKDNRADVGEMLYSVLTNILFAATIVENEKESPQAREDALAGVRAEWKTTRAEVDRMIKRQACFEYFQGVGLGALVTVPLLGLAGWAAVRFGWNVLNEPKQPASLSAAMMGGAVGAVISVTQRMARGNLKIDFTAPRLQKIVLGTLRPLIGAVFGTVIYFIIIAGILAVQADVTTSRDASIALAFFAVAGFAAGFSERLAIDVVEKAGSSIVPDTRGSPAEEKTEELSLLQSQRSRRAGDGKVSPNPSGTDTPDHSPV